ncbi:MAG: regulatory iron-sulfur-containing complex subunit RicT [Acidobacteriota bacterium]|nr:regulatory iron-sulfur-containing complex subunit RicT [Acidobacteriota bacterium]
MPPTGNTSPAPSAPSPFVSVVSVKFPNIARAYQFDSGELEFIPGDYCIVQTERGDDFGEVVQATRRSPQHCGLKGIKKVLRRAEESDREIYLSKRAREDEAFAFCQMKIGEKNLKMKLVRISHSWTSHKAIVFFTAEERVDFRELVRELAQHMHMRVEMRQIGLRDEAKVQGGCGPCGRQLCCSTWLKEFQPISIKMARAQGLSLNPSKLTGMCGRLKCCLRYEYDQFVLTGGDPAKFAKKMEDHPGARCPGGGCGSAPPPS